MSNNPPTWFHFMRLVGPSVRAWRKRHSLTLADLSERSGVHTNTLARFERGEQVRTGTLGDILDAVGLQGPEWVVTPTVAENERLLMRLRKSENKRKRLQTEVNRLERLRRGDA